MRRRLSLRIGILAIGLAAPAILIVAWIARYGSYVASDGWTFAHGTANLAGLLAIAAVALLSVLGSRFAPVERLFGLDRMLRWHKRVAKAGVALALAHVVLRTLVSSGGFANWDWGLLVGLGDGWGLATARLAFYGLLLFPTMAFAGGLGLAFRFWKPFHYLMYGAAGLSLAHARLIGSDFDAAEFVVGWAILVAILGVAAITRAGYLLTRNRRFRWTVEKTIQETHDTTSLTLVREGDASGFARRRPGQFAMIRRNKRRIGWSEPHPFTISCAPSSRSLRFTVKRSGPFSSSIPGFEVGEPVLCEGPYGVFTPDRHPDAHHLLVAGGVGITPFLSMLRDAADEESTDRFTVVWANKSRADIIAADELAALSSRLPLEVVHVLSREPAGVHSERNVSVRFREGHIASGLLAKEVRGDPTAFYVCGPSGMSRAAIKAIRKAYGTRSSKVRREAFTW